VEWRRHHSTLLLDRSPWLRVFGDDLELPDGRRIDAFLRLEARDVALAFATTSDGNALFVRQFKPGISRVVLQPAAGYLEPGEAPEACARRELLEETGHTAGEWEPLGSFHRDGNWGMGVAHMFLARGVRHERAPEPGDEDLRLIAVSLAEVPSLLRAGEFPETGPALCVTLALAQLARDSSVIVQPRPNESGGK
jgi:ADP-ribose pyrophosphatase